jgi:hypothetical protein
MTKIEIIDETVEFYKNNPRAVLPSGVCLYLTDEGNRCAHSRCIKDELIEEIHSRATGNWSASRVIDEFGDGCHKPEYQGHPKKFWCQIQRIHDRSENWDNNTLTPEGERFVRFLKQDYRNE